MQRDKKNKQPRSRTRIERAKKKQKKIEEEIKESQKKIEGKQAIQKQESNKEKANRIE